MKQLLIQLYLLSSVLCGLLALGLLTSSGLKVLSARLLGINYALYSVQQLLAVVVLSYAWMPAMILRPSIALALGPAMYWYYASLLRADSRFSALSLLHLLPSLTLLGAFLLNSPLARWTDAFIVASFTGYFLVIVRLLFSGVAGLAHLGDYARSAYRWLLLLAGLMLVNLLVELGAWLEIGTNKPSYESRAILFGVVIFLAFNLFALVLMLKRAPLVEWMHALQELRLPRAKILDDKEAAQIFARWQALVVEKSLHKREGGVTLDQAGRMMGVPARQISIAVNRVYGSSFSQYLNDCRVKEAQRLLVEQPALPITSLMLEAGFTTKSNFNKEFQRVTGMAPGDYRKREITSPAAQV